MSNFKYDLGAWELEIKWTGSPDEDGIDDFKVYVASEGGQTVEVTALLSPKQYQDMLLMALEEYNASGEAEYEAGEED